GLDVVAYGLCSQEQYDVWRDQMEAMRISSQGSGPSYSSYSMIHNRAKARDPVIASI
ncbi:hypothetical protein HAX54_022332, partial [Datura stramonium]|nr:hypothetical protein [Datura stramonium]